MHFKACRMQQGFSLVELSIVLVILGLLTGGILAGQSLIRASEIRSISADAERYQSALYSFRDRYMSLPGDMRNATRFWGAQAGATTDGVDSTCAALTTAATGQPTCNGDGNGQIGNSGVHHEMFRAWQHLANAGLVEGSYAGINAPGGSGGSTYYSVVGFNVPKTKISNAGVSFTWYHGTYSDASRYNSNYGNIFYIGAQDTDYTLYRAFLKAEEMWNIDVKLDDGKPAFGKVMSFNNTARPNCSTSDIAASAEHDLETLPHLLQHYV